MKLSLKRWRRISAPRFARKKESEYFHNAGAASGFPKETQARCVLAVDLTIEDAA
jgi:hypothetical protein